jgi:hypothetical protein
MYSDSVVDKEMEPCFLLNNGTRESPKKNVPPLVLFFRPHSYLNQHQNGLIVENYDS